MSSVISIDTENYDISMGLGKIRFVSGGGLTGNIYVNGNVGIGVSEPKTPLHIITNSTSNNSDTNGIYLYNPNNTVGQNAIIGSRVAGSSAGNTWLSMDINGVTGWSIGIDNRDSQKLKIQNSWDFQGGPKVTILTNGRVGIGTTTPAYNLDVTGTARVTTGGLFGLGSYAQLTAYSGTSPSFMIRNDGLNTYFLLTNNADPFGEWNAFRPFTIDNTTGDISIGTKLKTQPRSFTFSGSQNTTSTGGTFYQTKILAGPTTGDIYTVSDAIKNGSGRTLTICVVAQCNFGTNGSAARNFNIRNSAGTNIAANYTAATSNAAGIFVQTSYIGDLTNGDYIYFVFQQNSGSALSISTSYFVSYLN